MPIEVVEAHLHKIRANQMAGGIARQPPRDIQSWCGGIGNISIQVCTKSAQWLRVCWQAIKCWELPLYDYPLPTLHLAYGNLSCS